MDQMTAVCADCCWVKGCYVVWVYFLSYKKLSCEITAKYSAHMIWKKKIDQPIENHFSYCSNLASRVLAVISQQILYNTGILQFGRYMSYDHGVFDCRFKSKIKYRYTTCLCGDNTQKNPSSNQDHYDSPQGHQYNASIVMLEH